jgi:hypothetical protein
MFSPNSLELRRPERVAFQPKVGLLAPSVCAMNHIIISRPPRIPFSGRLAFLFALVCLPLCTLKADFNQDVAFDMPLRATSAHHIAIPVSALGKEFLLSGSIIPQFNAATSTGLAGKIVRFELFHDGVDLYEATDGLVVTEDLPARRLLTTFPILEQSEQEIVIDFNRGMRRVFTDIWYSTSSAFLPASLSRSLELPQSRVFETRIEANRLVIRQSAQVRNRDIDTNREERYEIRYYFSLYHTPDFVIKETSPSDARYVRFFETHPRLESTSGRPTSAIARFDSKQPIPFYYSANTPDPYVDAVRDGILYWNLAFGREVVTALPAPQGVTAPDARHNLIQWVPWDRAGFAYADVLVDPRTGMSLHGQVYFTSVFAISGRARARELLRTMQQDLTANTASDDDPDHNHDSAPSQPLDPDFFPSSSVCKVDQRAFARQMVTGLKSLLADDTATDEAVLRASQDYVRQVVAHEVGHVLGLRHNFAGSLEATLSHKALDTWFSQYLAGDEPNVTADMLASSSVMEYVPFKAAIFVGYQIRTLQLALPHDLAAIQWGYFDSSHARDQRLLFATDQDAFRYGDVQVFDYGNEPVVTAYAELAEQIDLLPHSVIETFIRAKAPRDPRDQAPLEEVNLSVTAAAARLAAAHNRLLLWFRSSTRSLKIENAFDFVGDLNRQERLETHWSSLNDQISKLGGVDRAAFAFLPVDLKLDLGKEPEDVLIAEKMNSTKLGERLESLLEAPAYRTFVGLDDQTHSFTQEEKDLILQRGRRFFEELEKELVKRTVQTFERADRDLGLQATGSVGDDDVVAKLEQRIIDLSRAVIMAKDDSQRRRGRVDKGLVEVIDFKYDHETRLAAARALNDNIGSFRAWSVDAKGTLNRQLKDDVEAALNIQNFKSFQDSMLSRPLRDWYLNQQAILALLPPRRPAQTPGTPSTNSSATPNEQNQDE